MKKVNQDVQEQLNLNEKWIPKFPVNSKGRLCFSAMMIAKRNSGKTYLTQHFIENYLGDKFDRFYVFAEFDTIDDYKKFMPKYKTKFFDGFRPSKMYNIMYENAKIPERSRANILMICDDTSSIKQRYSEVIADIYMKGRHAWISVIFNTQHTKYVDTSWRENSDLIFIFRTALTSTRKGIVDNMISGSDLEIYFDRVCDEKKYYENRFRRYTNTKYHVAVVDILNGGFYWFKAD